MSALVSGEGRFEQISPELVLISPPSEAWRARQALSETPFVAPAAPAPVAHRRFDLGLLAFSATCILGTIGPFLLAAVASR